MELLILSFRFIHLFGFAGVISSLGMIKKDQKMKLPRLFYLASIIQLISGIVLTSLKIDEINGLKVMMKLLVLALILLLGVIWRNKELSKTKKNILGCLVITTTIIAVFL